MLLCTVLDSDMELEIMFSAKRSWLFSSWSFLKRLHLSNIWWCWYGDAPVDTVEDTEQSECFDGTIYLSFISESISTQMDLYGYIERYNSSSWRERTIFLLDPRLICKTPNIEWIQWTGSRFRFLKNVMAKNNPELIWEMERNHKNDRCTEA